MAAAAYLGFPFASARL
uniref:Uncharacterized protein n=1 Tax=Arundo donax TaxID=35708 RepID=A0A0A9HXM4_ARUDO